MQCMEEAGEADADADADAHADTAERTEGAVMSDAIASSRSGSAGEAVGAKRVSSFCIRAPNIRCGYTCMWCGGQSPRGQMCASGARVGEDSRLRAKPPPCPSPQR